MKTILSSDTRNLQIGETAIVECFEGHQFEWTKSSQYEWPACAECTAREIERQHAQCLAELQAGIEQITPRRFLATRTDHPDFNLRLWQAIKDWRPSEETPWLGLVGPTGKCKTRCSWLALSVLAKHMTQRGTEDFKSSVAPTFAAISGHEFAAAVLSTFSDNAEEKHQASKRLNACRTARILVFDDMDKMKVSTAGGAISAAGSNLHSLIDHRHANNLVTIWSANLQPAGIVAGMPENVGAPLAGRLIECSHIVTLK